MIVHRTKLENRRGSNMGEFTGVETFRSSSVLLVAACASYSTQPASS